MKEGFKSLWGGFRSWLNYVREYKDNKDYCEIKEAEVLNACREIERLKDHIKELEITSKLKDELIEKRDSRIELLNARVSELMKANKEATGEAKKIKKGIKKIKVK